jgi:hypothetical protein
MTVMMVGKTVDLICNWMVSFTPPYIMLNIGGGIGYIFAGSSVLALLFAIFLLPELQGRSLEEMGELLKLKLGVWSIVSLGSEEWASSRLHQTEGQGFKPIPRLTGTPFIL